jgi:hypothetical protein
MREKVAKALTQGFPFLFFDFFEKNPAPVNSFRQ